MHGSLKKLIGLGVALGSIGTLLGLLAGCASWFNIESKFDDAVKSSIKGSLAARDWNRKPHGGSDEKSSLAPCSTSD